jgi:NADH:ubiquinone oxidoreductase subunit K
MLTGVNLNFITFATFCDNTNLDGYIMSLFYVAIGAVELAVALYIFYLMYRKKESENIDKYGDL